jgi:hypothetical protein
MKLMPNRKREIIQFCGRLERCCGRMNSGLAAVALVLAATTAFMSAVRVSNELGRDDHWGTLPFIEMSTDGPDNGLWMTD